MGMVCPREVVQSQIQKVLGWLCGTIRATMKFAGEIWRGCSFTGGSMHIKPFCLSLFACIACTLLGCDSFAGATGHIVDGDGTPVNGATVKLFVNGDLDRESTSNDDGAFSMSTGGPPNTHLRLELRVEKKGYKQDVRQLPWDENDSLRVVLERDLKKPKRP